MFSGSAVKQSFEGLWRVFGDKVMRFLSATPLATDCRHHQLIIKRTWLVMRHWTRTPISTESETKWQLFCWRYFSQFLSHSSILPVCMNDYSYQNTTLALQWRHNERDGVLNHQPHDCLLSHLFRRRSKKTSKLHVTGLCAGNSPVSGEFPAQMASILMTSSCDPLFPT